MATLFTSSSSVIDDDDASFSSTSNGFLPTSSTSSAPAAAAAADDDGNKHPTQQDQQQTTHATTFNLYHEVKHLIHLTLPSVLVQLCLYFLFPQAASVVGREFGSEALAGFSLGTLVGNLTVLSIVVGALTAADTLMPRAFATGKYDELGILLIQSLIVCTLLLILPLIPLCTVMEPILLFLGQDPIASQLASEWIRVYLWGVPANVVFRAMQRFLVAQHQPWPPVFCAAIPCFLVQPILLPILTSSIGFLGSAVSIVITQWTVTILLGIQTYCCPVHHPGSWPNFHYPTNSWNRALKPSSLRRFISLSIGGVLSLSEWWFWETMCFIAGSFGVEALCAHTIAYNMIPLLYMIPLGFSIGLVVRMGHNLSCGNIYTAKRIAAWCMGGVAVLGFIVSILMWTFRDSIIGLFISKYDYPLVLEETKQIWPMVCIYIFVLYIFGINGSILKGLGLQWNLATWIFVCLWCGLLPCVVYWAMIRQGGLQVQWTLLPTFYVILQLCLIVNYTTADWKQIMIRQQQRRQREASLRASSRRSLLKDNIDDDDVVMVTGRSDNTPSPHQAPDEKTPLVLSRN